jgi:hypothetical protein
MVARRTKKKPAKGKSKKKKSTKLRLNLEVDTSDWETGGWPADLEETLNVTCDDGNASVTFEVDGKLWEQAARKIAKEAIEVFFDGMYVELTKNGVRLLTDMDDVVLIPFSKISCAVNKEDRDDLVRALNAQSYDDDGNYEPYSMGELMAGVANRKS